MWFGALLCALVVPLVVALVALHGRHWHPILDLAATEIRVRGVPSTDPPLIGLYGRIGLYGNGGSHPGPLSFFALWPVWLLLGKSSFGLQAATVALDGAAITLCLWMVYRRGGLRLVAGFTLVLAVLMHAYGAFLLTLPWNPFLPVLWWIVFLLAVWSVLDGDYAMVPVGVLAGTMCVQTHISYLGLVGGVTAFAAVALAHRAYRSRDRPERRAMGHWCIAGAALGVVLWIPPVIDQIAHSPGNLSTIRDYFSDPPDPPLGLHAGVDALLTQMDPVRLVTHVLGSGYIPEIVRPTGWSRFSGALLVVAWLGAVVVARRRRHRALVRLHIVLGVALALGFVSAARILGEVFYYVLLWAQGLAALMLFAIGWTAASLVRSRVGWAGRPAPRRAAAGGLAVLIVAVTALSVNSAARVDVQAPRISASLNGVVGPTVAALRAMERAGERGPFLVTWLPDPQAIGSEGYGLLNELDRRGLDVRASTVYGRFVPYTTSEYTIDPARAAVEVHLALGAEEIARWRGDDRFREVAYSDPRTDAERAELAGLRRDLIGELQRAGLADRATLVDDDLFALGVTPGLTARARRLVSRMFALGMPAAVFVGPSTCAPASGAPGPYCRGPAPAASQ